MNILFEIADSILIAIALVIVLILIIIAVIYKIVNNKMKVKPISEDERYDNDIQFVNVDEPNVSLTDEQAKAKEELERVFNQMSEDLKKQNETSKDDIDEFERQQEESAIISYQELMAEAEKLKATANEYERQAEENADMKVSSAINTFEEHSKQLDIEQKPVHQGFKNSDIISPIYGIQNKTAKKIKKQDPVFKTNSIIGDAYNEINNDEEKMENKQFLNSLKEFRKNL